MKLLTALSLSFLLASAAFAQSAPVITSISPKEGPTKGGTAVVITGSGFETTVQCILPCPTTVTFDKTEVVPAETTDSRILVVAPPHPQGNVDVTVRTGDGRTTTAPAGFRYVTSLEGAFTQVLFPVYTDGKVSGADGSMWQTDLWIRNTGGSPIELAPWVCPAGQACPAIFPLRHTLASGETLHNLPPFFKPPSANVSRVLHVTNTEADRLAMQLRIADVTRSPLNAGTELPVVRERDLRVSSLDLLNVPFDAQFRVMLRAYDLQNTSARFRVSVYDQADANAAAIHSFEMEVSTTESGEFRSQAAYGQFNLETLREQKRVWPAALRLRIEPLTGGSRFWAFASITNNTTQLVTTVSPQ